MFDPFASAQDKGTLGAPAGDHFAVVPTDATMLQKGVKAIEVENLTGVRVVLKITSAQAIDQTLANAVAYGIPAYSIRPILLRAVIVWANGMNPGDVAIIAYTD